jgi:hypothetical protein
MSSTRSDWIAVTGVRSFDLDTTETAIPWSIMNDERLSLIAKGLYGRLLSYEGQPLDPYDEALDDLEDIAAAIDQLLGGGYAVRVAR